MITNVTELLLSAKVQIQDPLLWCKGSRAMNGVFDSVSPISGDAIGWCALGAIIAVSSNNTTREVMTKALDYLAISLPHGFTTVTDYNNHKKTTHDDIMALYDRAVFFSKGMVPW